VKVLVTGATGFIANHVILQLLSKGHRVIATAREKDKAEKFDWFHLVHFVPFDMLKESFNYSLYDYFQKPDVLIHLAWSGLPDFENPIHLDLNLPMHTRFLKNYIKSGGKHIVVAGTCQEYGLQSGCLSENIKPIPTTAYGKAKNELRIYLEQLQKNYRFCFQWIRLFYMFGSGQHPTSIIPQLAASIKRNDSVFNMSGGKQTRDYLPVTKVAAYICRIAAQREVDGIINCCSGNPISIKQLVEKFINENQASIQLNLGFYPYTSYEPMHFWGDNAKLKSI
jgi:dTDP-6-deoxy-L-talose 4-dehydrogenase (NAD+)